MREIKFRGKSLKTKKWVYGDLMSNICGTRIVRYKETDNGSYKRADWEYIDVDPSTVGQFTRLTDRNGKEIYEGDIVHFSFKRLHNQDRNAYVFYKDGEWMCQSSEECNPTCLFPGYKAGVFDIEVVGNIHDNPELINQPTEVWQNATDSAEHGNGIGSFGWPKEFTSACAIP